MGKFIFVFLLACLGIWFVGCVEIVNNSGNISDPLGLLCLIGAFYTAFQGS